MSQSESQAESRDAIGSAPTGSFSRGSISGLPQTRQEDSAPEPVEPTPPPPPPTPLKEGPEPPKKKCCAYVTPTLALSVFSAGLCPFSFGYNISVVNNPQAYIKEFINQSMYDHYGAAMSCFGLDWLWSFIVSGYCIFALGGIFAGQKIAKSWGCKKGMLYNNILLFIGALLMGLSKAANSWEMLTIGRMIIGVNNGASTVFCPIYFSEISPKAIQGGVGATFQLTVVFGQLVSSILGFKAIFGKELWPWLFFILCFVAVLQLTLLACPESPKFLLVEKNNEEKARKALRRLRGEDEDISAEMQHIKEEDAAVKAQPVATWKDFRIKKELSRPLAVACVIMIAQQLSGINAVMAFSQPIFDSALPEEVKTDENSDLPNGLTATVSVINLLVTLTAPFTIDRCGRKKMLFIGLVGMACCSFLAAFLLSNVANKQGCPGSDVVCHGIEVGSVGKGFAIGFLLLDVGFFALGPGPVPWLIVPELFLPGARAKAVSIATSVNWGCSFIVQLTFFVLLKSAICGWVYLIYVAFLAFCIPYIQIKLPETTGLHAEEVVKLFTGKKWPVKPEKNAEKLDEYPTASES